MFRYDIQNYFLEWCYWLTIINKHFLFTLTLAAGALLPLTTAHAFNLFGPSDYEECAADAAKDAKSKAALKILLQTCSSDFQARRKTGGGYIWCPYIPDLSKSVCIDVAKPKVTKSDRQRIETVLQEQRQNAILRDLADRGALDKMQIVAWDFSCDDPFRVDKRTYDPSYASSPEPVYEGSSGSCVGYHVTGQIHNGSNKTVTQIGVGFQALYGQQRCSSASLS